MPVDPVTAISLNAPKWKENPDDLINSPPKRYCTAHHEGFHSFCRSCVQESILDLLMANNALLQSVRDSLDILVLKP